MKKILRSVHLIFALPLIFVVGSIGTGLAAEKEVAVGYQLIYNPWAVAIAKGEFEKATGYKISWRKFDSGAKAVAALAAGEVDITLAGSSPIAAGVSRGVDMQLFWIVENIAAAEALVVRDGSGIVAPQDLKGKTLGVPFVSTAHFHTMFALEQFGINPVMLKILNLQPNEITEAWDRGELDAAFVWDPALSHIKKTGKVLVTSGLLGHWGRPTFDGMVVRTQFGEENPDFVTKFVKVMADADAAYRDDPKAWTPNSDRVKAIVEVVGGNAEDVPVVLALYEFPTMEQQVSCAWLGCGNDGGAARALMYTAKLLKDQKKLDELPPDFSKFVTPKYVEAAMKLE